jgi:hypothetical protein
MVGMDVGCVGCPVDVHPELGNPLTAEGNTKGPEITSASRFVTDHGTLDCFLPRSEETELVTSALSRTEYVAAISKDDNLVRPARPQA